MVEENKEKEKGKGPVFKHRVGEVSGAVWVNPTSKGNMLTVSFQRSYQLKGANNVVEWKHSNSFGVNALPKLESVAKVCWLWILEHQAEYRNEPENAGDV